jgi:hypothetical protein
VTPSDGVPWLVDWSDRGESEIGGRVALNENSTDELSDQAVLLSGFYVFKKPKSTSWQHSPPREQVPIQISQNSATRSQVSDDPRNAASPGASRFSGFASRSGSAQDLSEMIDGVVMPSDVEEVWSNLFVHRLGLNFFGLHSATAQSRRLQTSFLR